MGNCLKSKNNYHKENSSIRDPALIQSELVQENRNKYVASMEPNVSTFSQEVYEPSKRLEKTVSNDDVGASLLESTKSNYQLSDAISNLPNILSMGKATMEPELKFGVPNGCRVIEKGKVLDKLGKSKGFSLYKVVADGYGCLLAKCVVEDDKETVELLENELRILTFIQRSPRKSKKNDIYRSKAPTKAGYENVVYKNQYDNVIGFVGYMEASTTNSLVQRRLLTECYVDTLRSHVTHRTERGRRDMKHYEAALYAFQMAKGLHALHKLKVCHRDLNTDNIIMGLGLLDKEYKEWLRYVAKAETRKQIENYSHQPPSSNKSGKTYNYNAKIKNNANRSSPTQVNYYKFLHTQPLIAKIANFGHAKRIQNGRTKTMTGSMQFMAPEMIQEHEYNISVDIWGFGCIIYEMLAGKAPFHKKPVSYIETKVINGKFPKNELIGGRRFENLNTIMRNCLKVEPALRCRARELVEDLGKL